MGIENLNTKSTSAVSVPTKAVRDKAEADTFSKVLDILDELLNHNHLFTDNYGSACQCQCQCNCQCRGIL